MYCANLNLNVNVITFVVCFAQESFYGREVIVADREFVEQNVSWIEEAREKDVAFLGNGSV